MRSTHRKIVPFKEACVRRLDAQDGRQLLKELVDRVIPSVTVNKALASIAKPFLKRFGHLYPENPSALIQRVLDSSPEELDKIERALGSSVAHNDQERASAVKKLIDARRRMKPEDLDVRKRLSAVERFLIEHWTGSFSLSETGIPLLEGTPLRDFSLRQIEEAIRRCLCFMPDSLIARFAAEFRGLQISEKLVEKTHSRLGLRKSRFLVNRALVKENESYQTDLARDRTLERMFGRKPGEKKRAD